MDTKVSVVIPVYKVEEFLPRCIESVINQSLKEIEIIAIDDGSPDKSGEILDYYSARDKRINVIHKQNAGVSAARNDGMELCKGKYIYIMDSDDYIEPDSMKIMYETAEKHQADIVISDHYFFYGNDEKCQEEKHFFSKEFYSEDKKLLLRLIDMVLYPMYSPYPTAENTGLGLAAPWTKLVKKELIDLNKLVFDSDVKGIFDDGLFALDVFYNANSVAYIRSNTYHYRQLPTSLMRGYNKNRIDINETVYEKINHFREGKEVDDMYDEAYNARILLYLKYAFDAFVFHKRNQCGLIDRFKKYIEVISMPSYVQASKKTKNNLLRPTERKMRAIILSRIVAIMYFIKRIARA